MEMPEGLTSYAWVAVCSIAAPAVFGLGLVRALGLDASHGHRTAWAYAWLAGQLALAPVTLSWIALGQPVPGVALPAGAALTGAWLAWRHRSRAGRTHSPWFVWLPLALLAAGLLHDFLLANTDVVRLSDEAQIWAAKAKALYATPDVDLAWSLPRFVQHADYPLWNPLVQVLAFASAGRVLHFENRLPIQFFALALLVLLSAATTRRAHPAVSAIVLFAFAGTLFLEGAMTVYADVMLSFATLCTVDSLLRLRETGERVWWRLACMGFAGMLSAKNEGALLTIAVAVPFAVCWWLDRRRGRSWGPPPRALPWLLAPLAAIVVHAVFNARFGLRNDLTGPDADGRGLLARTLAHLGDRTWQVIEFHARLLVEPGAHRLLPLAFFLAAALPPRRADVLALLGVVACAIAGYVLVFTGTSADLTWHMATAAARTMQHVVPVAALGLCIALWPRNRAFT
jgi:hypothetical protein